MVGTVKDLIIVGARGFGREIFSATSECIGYGTEFSVKGFLDSKRDALEGFPAYAPILGSPETYPMQPNDVFFVALGDVRWRSHYAEMISSRGGAFMSLVHREAHVGKNVVVGAGSFLGRGASLSVDVVIGHHCCIVDQAIIGHDCRIGSHSHISSQVFLGGGVQIGSCVTLHPGAKVAPHKKIGEGATVGISSVVISNVKPGDVVFGFPAVSVADR